MAITDRSLVEVAAGLRDGSWSSSEVTRACLDRAKKQASVTKAYVTLMEEAALAAAEAADARFRNKAPL